MYRPLAMAVIFLCLGIVLAARTGTVFWLIFLTVVFATVGGSIFLKRRFSFTRAIILLGFLVAGILWAKPAMVPRGYMKDLPGQYVSVTGEVIRVTDYSNRQEVTVRVKKLTVDGKMFDTEEKVLAVLYNRHTSWLPGDLVRVRGEVAMPQSGGNLGEFNYRDYLLRRGISARLTVDDVELLTPGRFSFSRFVVRTRRVAVKRIFQTLPKRQAAAIVGMLFGEKHFLGKDDTALYQNLGVMHVFAVSGLHVGFVAALLLGLTGKLTFQNTALTAAFRFAVTAAGLLFYAGLAGFSASVVRATVLTLVGLLAYLVDRRNDFYTALALAAFVWLLFRPLALFDAGFQLSFMAALSIYYLYPVADRLFSFLPRWRGVITVPLVAQLGLLPLLAYHFGTVSLLAIPANIPVVFLAGTIILLGLTGMLVQLVYWPAAQLLLYSSGMLVEIVNRYLFLLGEVPLAYFYVGLPSPAAIFVYYMGLIAVREGVMGNLKLPEINRRLLKWGLAVALVGILLITYFPQKQLQVVFLDVGQGDAAVVMTPRGKNVLIDAAGGGFGSFDVGRDRLVPALHRLGIRRIDLFLNSHPDRDHIGGLSAVVSEFPVGLAVFPVLSAAARPELFPYLSLLEKAGVSYRFLAKGSQIRLDSRTVLEVLHPPAQLPSGEWALNDQSLVVMLRHGQNKFLFTGDIEYEAISQLFSRIADLTATVVKVPHHGAGGSFSKAFYRRLRPRVAVISVGRNNFGHPSPKVTSYLQQQKILVYRTDRHGAVTVTSDGKRLWIKTAKQKERKRAAGL